MFACAVHAQQGSRPPGVEPVSQSQIDAQRNVGQARTGAMLNVHQCERPPYPKEAARYDWQGTVILVFLVGVDGKVKETKVERSSGHQVLDEQAIKYLSACEYFKPGTINGKPVEAWAKVAYEWKIQ